MGSRDGATTGPAHGGRTHGSALAPAWIERALLAVLVALFVWQGLIPAWERLSTDFPNYYLGARLYRDGYPLERLYDWIWIQRQKDHAGLDQSFVGYVPLTFFSALVVAPLASLPALEAKRCWLVACLLLLLGTGWLLRRTTGLPPRRIALIIFLAIVPLRTNFQFGQQHVLLLFLLTLAAWLYFEDRRFGAGSVLAVASALKLYPLLFGLMFVRKRQWRALTGLIAGSLLLGLVGLALFGWEPLRVYVVQVLPRAVLRAEVTDPYSVHLSSFTGLLRHLLVFEPELNPHPLAHAPAAFAILQPLIAASILISWLGSMTPGNAPLANEKLDWATTLAFLLLLSSGTASYHFCVLILGAVLAAEVLLGAGRANQARVLVALFGLVCFPYYRLFPDAPDGWAILLGYPRLYATLAFCIALLWAHRSLVGRSTPRPSRVDAAALGLGFVAFVVAGIISNLHHFDGQFASYPRRLATGSLMAAEPATAGRDVYVTRMDDESYVVGQIGAGWTAAGPVGADLFHPTVAASDREAWLEIAARTSRIARVSLDAPPSSARDLPVEVEDGEQPVISADGRWLAFIRPHRGRGSLWLMDRRGGEPGQPSTRPQHEVVDVGYDVLEVAFFPDNRIVFASAEGTRSRLFLIDARSRQPSALTIFERSVRYPAISPDGRWMAYCELEGSNWQLWTMRLPDGERRRLTEADCNSVSPAWFADSRTLVYATDCGRGLGHTAISWLTAVP